MWYEQKKNHIMITQCLFGSHLKKFVHTQKWFCSYLCGRRTRRASSMCVSGGICREGGTPSPAADCRRVPRHAAAAGASPSRQFITFVAVRVFLVSEISEKSKKLTSSAETGAG
jgi:hypothetical protein